MPIRPDLRKFYDGNPEWRAAREIVRLREEDRCRHCGGKNGAIGFHKRLYPGRRFIELTERDAQAMARIDPSLKIVRIQCGCSHRFPVPPMDYRPENLLWLCRGCHLIFDKGGHKRSRQVRRDRGRPLLAMLEATG